MKHLFTVAKKYKKECLCGPLFKLFEVVFELNVPIVMKNIIDVGIASSDTSYIIKMSVVLVILAIAGLSVTVVAQYYSAKAAVGITCEIKHDLMTHIQALSYSDLDTLHTSTLITRMTQDCNQVQTGINLTLRLLLRSPFIVFGTMIMAFTVDVGSALVFTVLIPLLAVAVFGIMLWCIPLYKKVQQLLDGVLGATRENLSGIKVIRAFCAEDEEKAEFDRKNDLLNTAQRFVGRISAIMNPLTYVLVNFGIIVLIYVGSLRVYGGKLTQGAVVSLYNYMLLILTELVKLANLIITVTKSVACENRIEAVLDTKPSMSENKNANTVNLTGAVEFTNVSFAYENSPEKALSNISFKAKSGEFIGIIGSTGSGKTTLVNLIPRFYDAISGGVFIDNVNVKDMPIDMLRKNVGIVPQRAVLFEGTVRDNLLMGNENATDEQLYNALKTAQADTFLDENGLDAFVSQNGGNFSGGQRQRLTLARALVREPAILILDDSGSALDFATDAAIRKSITALLYKPTVFSVSQRTSSVKNADKIIVLEDGEVMGIGKHSELLESCEVYREIYDSQFGGEESV